MIDCRNCGCNTNPCPDDFPEDWRGLCPRCAFEAYSEGRISCPTPELINNIAAVAIVLMDDVVASGPGADLFMDPEAYLKAGLN